jgi:ribosomal-protein-alanine N-acetyltransferase
MGVVLRGPSARYERQFLDAVHRSRAIHAPFVSPPATPEAFRRYLRRMRKPDQAAFWVFDEKDRAIAGVVDVANIVRGPLQSGSLGYYAFLPYAGRGLMREGLRLAVDYCFRRLKLHRLEANIQPHNERSVQLVLGLGFRLEGLSLRYLKVRGRWRDHQRWAVTTDEWRSRKRPLPRGGLPRAGREDAQA